MAEGSRSSTGRGSGQHPETPFLPQEAGPLCGWRAAMGAALAAWFVLNLKAVWKEKSLRSQVLTTQRTPAPRSGPVIVLRHRAAWWTVVCSDGKPRDLRISLWPLPATASQGKSPVPP